MDTNICSLYEGLLMTVVGIVYYKNLGKSYTNQYAYLGYLLLDLHFLLIPS